MKAVNRVEKQQRPDPLVKILATAAEGFELVGLGDQFIERRGAAERVERLIPHGSVGRSDELDEFARPAPGRSWPDLARFVTCCRLSGFHF
jgi:hypothetical protein